MKLKDFGIVLVAATAIGVAVPASAGKLLEDIESDSADRIRVATQLPTLTQQVAAASCALTSGVDEEEAYEVLQRATKAFDRYMVALREGDEGLHILYPEENPKLLLDLEHVLAEWSSIHDAVDAVLADGHDVDSAHIIDDHNLKLLELTSILASDVSGVYARPFEMAYSDAMLIEIAGRQRMFTQKMAKDACEIWTGYHAEEGREDLAVTMVKFDATLHALREGMPSMGIEAAPNAAIRHCLDNLLGRWSVLEVNLQSLVDGETLDEDQKYEIFHDLWLELLELEKLLDEYKAHAERRQ